MLLTLPGFVEIGSLSFASLEHTARKWSLEFSAGACVDFMNLGTWEKNAP